MSRLEEILRVKRGEIELLRADTADCAEQPPSEKFSRFSIACGGPTAGWQLSPR
jgi:hypothetical protein